MPTDTENGSDNATKNYRSIEWTPKRSFELSQLYSDAHVSMQCQSGNGDQLPGDWTRLKPPEIKKVMPVYYILYQKFRYSNDTKFKIE